METLGDAVYMVAGGVPDRNPQHAVNIATVALKLQDRAKTVMHQIGKDNLITRIGMDICNLFISLLYQTILSLNDQENKVF